MQRLAPAMLLVCACNAPVFPLPPPSGGPDGGGVSRVPDAGIGRADSGTPDLGVVGRDAAPRDLGVPDASGEVPPCDRVQGTNHVVFSRDEGRTTSEPAGPLDPPQVFGRGIAVTPEGRVWAHIGGALLLSEDQGCTFRPVPTSIGLVMTRAPDGTIFGFDRFSGLDHWRIQEDQVELIQGSGVLPSGTVMIGHGFDGNDLRRMRFIAGDGAIYTSTDGGRSFLRTAEVPISGPGALLEHALVNPDAFSDLLVAGNQGVLRSRDGGATWSTARAPGSGTIYLARSPVDSRVVWAHGLSGNHRELWATADGGDTFQAALRDTEVGGLGPGWFQIVPSAASRTVVYLGDDFGLRRFDSASGRVDSSLSRFRVGGVAFHPQIPGLIYIALENLR